MLIKKLVLTVKRRGKVKCYCVKTYIIEKEKEPTFLGHAIVGTQQTLPIIKEKKVVDIISGFSYALLEKDKRENLIGLREEYIEQVGFDIGILKEDIKKENLATIDRIMEYQELYPLSPVSEKQDSLNFPAITPITTRKKR